MADLSSELQTHNSKLLTLNSFDLVVSNPPFRKVKTGRLSIGDEKVIVRHEIKLSLKDMVKASRLHTSKTSRKALHYPFA